MKEFSLIIPTYNRKERLIKNIAQVKNTYPEAEIIIVDDGSLDGTDKEINHVFGNSVIYLRNAKNQGKGASLRKGFKIATGKFLIFTDDDLPYGINGIQNILRELKQGKPVVISRRDKFNDNFIKAIERLAFNMCIKPVLGINISDTQAGLKGFSREVAHKIFANSFINRFAVDIEILILCQRFNYPITIVPVHHQYFQPTSLSSTNILNIFLDVIRIKFHRYDKK